MNDMPDFSDRADEKGRPLLTPAMKGKDMHRNPALHAPVLPASISGRDDRPIALVDRRSRLRPPGSQGACETPGWCRCLSVRDQLERLVHLAPVLCKHRPRPVARPMEMDRQRLRHSTRIRRQQNDPTGHVDRLVKVVSNEQDRPLQLAPPLQQLVLIWAASR
jgi:hypothetical protein